MSEDKSAKPVINVTPLIDVLLVLLIIFMVAAPLKPHRFETKLPRDGRHVWFRLMTGADEARAAAALKNGRDGALLTALALRIVEIEGVADKDKRAFLDEMEMADAAALLDEFEEVDGGVETTLEVECLAKHRFATHTDARLTIFRYIEGWYNPHRRHSALGQRSPLAFEQAHAVQSVAA